MKLLPPTLAALALAAFALPAQEKAVVIRGAKVFTGTGSFQDGMTIVLQKGKVVAIGKSVETPSNADVIDANGKFVTPGLVDADTSLGLRAQHENEESAEVTPHMRVIEAIDPQSKDFERAVAEGVTTAYISAGDNNVFGGLGCIYKTAGDARLIRDESGLKMTLGMMPGRGNRAFRGGTPASIYYRRPTNRMGTIFEIRKAFYDAMDSRETKIGPTVAQTAATKVLIKALDRKLDVRTTARADQDIRTALRLAEEFNINIVLDGAVEAYYALDYIVAAKIPVVAQPPSLRSAEDTAQPHLDTLALLSNAGVPVAIRTGPSVSGIRPLPLIQEAAFAVRGGMNRDAALASITSVPAKILGVDDRVGSLAPGKDADVVIWSRHPLSPVSRAESVFVDGVRR